MTDGVENYYVCDINPQETFNILQEQKEKYKNMNPDQRPPFYCVPFAIKNSMNCKGFLNDFGCVNNLNYIADFDSEICKQLKQLGAIPICTTNIPQCYQGNTFNEIWGQVDNKFDEDRQAGGSSGGSALMVANNLIPLALGSDLTGSIKIPCQFAGVIGFVPTVDQISNYGVRNIMNGNLFSHSFQDIAMSIGPITRNVEDNQYFCQNIFLKKTKSNIKNQKKIKKFGYVIKDSFCEISDPQKNVILESVESLKSQGYICQEIPQFDKFLEISYINLRIFLNMFNIQDLIKKQLPKEKLSINLEALLIFSYIPNFLKGRILQKIVELFLGERPLKLFKALQPLKLQDYCSLVDQRNFLILEYFSYLEEQKIDIVLTPLSRFAVADLLDIDVYLNEDYSSFPNDLHTCSGVIPTRNVNENKDLKNEYKSKYNDNITEAIQNNLKNSTGNPLGIQVIGKPNQDQNCLDAMQIIENIWQYKSGF